MIVPLGVEDAPAGRLPKASIGIAAVCFIAFGLQQGCDDRAAFESIRALDSLLRERTTLAVPEPCVPFYRPEFVSTRREVARETPAPTELVREAELRCERARTDAMEAGDRRWALVPAKGLSQLGWLSHAFMHADVFHLVGNLLFLYLTAPLVEGALGAFAFLLFYAFAAFVSGAAHMALTDATLSPLVGASGAISACMGAFATLYGRHRVRVFYWLGFVLTGTTRVPALYFIGSYVLFDAWRLVSGGEGHVAVAAHLGGAAFGVAVAAIVRGFNLGRYLVRPVDDVSTSWRPDPALRRARTALEQGDPATARDAFEEVLSRAPKNEEALEALVALTFAAHDVMAGTRHLETLLARALSTRREPMRDLLLRHAHTLDAEALSTAGLLRFARELETLDDRAALTLHERAAARPGPHVGAGLVRVAELRARHQDEDGASRAATLALQHPLEHDERARADAVLQKVAEAARLERSRVTAAGLDATLVEAAVFVGREGEHLVVESTAAPYLLLHPADVRAVSCAIVEESGPGERNVLFLELVVETEGRRRALRFRSVRLGLATLFPAGTDGKEALGLLLAELVAHGPVAWPDVESILGSRFSRVPDGAAFDAATAAVRAA